MRLVIFSSVAPEVLRHLLWRLQLDCPEVVIAGVLYETSPPPLPGGTRVRRVARLLAEAEFRRYAAHKLAAAVRARATGLLDAALRFIHAAPAEPNGPPLALAHVVDEYAPRGVAFHVTDDLHDEISLAFVRGLRPDVGLVYGTRILKPALFTIPARGSINIHKHKVPDYRGAGAPGIWELESGCADQTVTVHRVVADVDAGAVLGERSFPIEPFDTLDSVQMKADVISVDLIVDVLQALREERAIERPQAPGGRLYKGYMPHRLHAIACRIRQSRPAWRPVYQYAVWKRAARLLVLPLLAWRNRRRTQARTHPVIVLFHHLVCDRPKRLGMPTSHFARHVRYLRKHYRIASLAEAVQMLERGVVDAPTVVLTLDDGYAENFLGLRAIAELERVPVTICACSRHVDDRSELAHDVARGERGFRSLGWDELRFLDRHGVTIASHTRSHADCGQADFPRLLDEIAGSRRELEGGLGHAVTAFAFPKGKPANMPGMAHRLALEHYDVVMSAAGGANVPPMRRPLELRRYAHPDSIVELELQVQEILDRAMPPRPVTEGHAFPSAALPSARG
jgi:folate-dependent phosphoribosylglycinamide formyltransferase PurN/peptidoglycan/xylan/chitin deacetylase (PgdA/CDA1 family)